MSDSTPLHRQSEPRWRILEGDCRAQLATLEPGSVQTCVTSPPYFGLRDYGHDGQIGLEPTPDEFVAAMVEVFRAVRRVLRNDGTAWLNLGDSYSGSGPSGASYESETTRRRAEGDGTDGAFRISKTLADRGLTYAEKKPVPAAGTKPKDLIGIPWMVAFALRADGWYLRSDIIWAKPNPMPESVTDRPTKAHEYLFLLSKSPRYFYDAEAISEEAIHAGETVVLGEKSLSRGQATGMNVAASGNGNAESVVVAARRNKRTVWTVPSAPFQGAHFATFPPNLIEPCILAGCPERACATCGAPWERMTEGGESTYVQRKALGYDKPQNMVVGGHPGHHNGIHPPGMSHDVTPAPKRTIGWQPSCECHAHIDCPDCNGRGEDPGDESQCDRCGGWGNVGGHGGHAPGEWKPSLVLDPFAGSGTTGMVALRHGRSFVGVELNPEYVQIARNRIVDDAPLLNQIAEAA